MRPSPEYEKAKRQMRWIAITVGTITVTVALSIILGGLYVAAHFIIKYW